MIFAVAVVVCFTAAWCWCRWLDSVDLKRRLENPYDDSDTPDGLWTTTTTCDLGDE